MTLHYLYYSLALVIIHGAWTSPVHYDYATYSVCGNYTQFESRGVIVSPDFVADETSNINCTLRIQGEPSEVITIVFENFTIDIPNGPEEGALTVCGSLTEPGSTPNCCLGALLKITELGPPKGNFIDVVKPVNVRQNAYCGRGGEHLPPPFLSESNGVTIQFVSLGNLLPKGGKHNITRRFTLRYRVSKLGETRCYPDEVGCIKNGKCIPTMWRCNGKRECEDGSDEKNCPSPTPTGTRPRQMIAEFTDTGSISVPEVKVFRKHCHGPEWIPCAPGLSHDCFRKSERCDGKVQCPNGFDEDECQDGGGGKEEQRGYLMCKHATRNATVCFHGSPHCYEKNMRCNSVLECPNGEDEIGCSDTCPHTISCPGSKDEKTEEKCFTARERCDGIAQCPDQYDELNCSPVNCGSRQGTYLCVIEGRCILENSRCDRIADCTDSEDEMYCIKNSVITAAIMGSLVCGILVVIAISCTCRLYAIRLLHYQRQQNCSAISSSASPEERFRRHSSISDSDLLRFDALQDLYCYYGFRDPPPPYSVAVAGDPPAIPPPPQGSGQGRRRRSRNHHRMYTRRNSTPGAAGAEPSTSAIDAPVAPEVATAHLEATAPPVSTSPPKTTSHQSSTESSSSCEPSIEQRSQTSPQRDAGEHLNKADCGSLCDSQATASTEIEFSVLPSSSSSGVIGLGAEVTSPSTDSQPLIGNE